MRRQVNGLPIDPVRDQNVLAADDYADMTSLLEDSHNEMHGFVNMGNSHISFRDPFVFLLHANVDRLFALWQLQPGSPERLDPEQFYGTMSADPEINGDIEPWATGSTNKVRPWGGPENLGIPKTYKDLSVVIPRRYDTNPGVV